MRMITIILNNHQLLSSQIRLDMNVLCGTLATALIKPHILTAEKTN